jgi:predicted DNA-binding ribbon-helix-helix protein
MAGGLKKRSVNLAGHATSLALEPEFWEAFREIAASRGKALNALAAENVGQAAVHCRG